MYASYEVTNTGGFAVADVWVEASGFTGGSVTLAPGEDGLVQLGAMAPGQSKTAYFYLRGTTLTASPQNHNIRVYASRPPVAPALTQAFTISSVQSTINANANKVTTVVSGPESAADRRHRHDHRHRRDRHDRRAARARVLPRRRPGMVAARCSSSSARRSRSRARPTRAW